MEIQTHKKIRKANLAENKVRVFMEEVAFERAMCSLPTIRQGQSLRSEVRGRITAKVDVCGITKRFPLKLKDELRALIRAVLNLPDQFATHI